MMAGIRRRDTDIELQVRQGLHRRGFRFRLDARELPGRPDIVLPKYSAVIQVHGCFWHGHDCDLFRLPATNRHRWKQKFDDNRARDKRTKRELQQAGWRVLEVWECSFKNQPPETCEAAIAQVARWLASGTTQGTISRKTLA